MRRYQVFAAGVSVALLLGAGTPALAAPGKGKGHAYGRTDSKPAKAPKAPAAPKPKKTKSGVSGGGAVTGGEFSIQGRLRNLDKGHFNYTSTDGKFKIRCRGFEADDVTISGSVATVDFDADDSATTRNGVRGTATVKGTFTDGGQPAETTPPTAGPDSVDLTVAETAPAAPVAVAGPVTGNIKVR